jgi:hypothetical protein
LTIGSISEENDYETQARLILDEYNRQSSETCFKSSSANWNYAVNINDDTEKVKLRESLEYSKFQKESWKNISSQFKTRDSFEDPVLNRMFQKISIIGKSASALSEEKLKEVLYF